MAGFFAICTDFLKPFLERETSGKIVQCRREKLYFMGETSIPALSWLETIPHAVKLVPRIKADKGGNVARKPSGDEVQGTTGRRKKISPSFLPLHGRLRQDGDVWERGKVLTPQISINKIPRLTMSGL